MEPSTRYAQSPDGASIAYQVHGDGALDLVFVPGFVSHVELIWEEPAIARFLRRLASFSRLLVFDKRGQGLSDRLGRPPTLEESMDDLGAVMDAAGAERAAVFGISEGGPMSALFAATYPDRVSSLVLYEPWAPSEEGNPEFERWWGRLLRQGTSPSGAIELMNLYREIDVRAVLPAISAPTLVLHRRDDRMLPARQGRYLAEHIPGARYVELDGTDHLPTVGDHGALLDEVEEFLVGSRGAHGVDRALATILFTDIVGSTDGRRIPRHLRRPRPGDPLRHRDPGRAEPQRGGDQVRHPQRRGGDDRRRRRRHGRQHRPASGPSPPPARCSSPAPSASWSSAAPEELSATSPLPWPDETGLGARLARRPDPRRGAHRRE